MLEKLLTAPHLVVLALMVFCVFRMRSDAVKSRRSRSGDADEEPATEFRARHRSAEGPVHQLEIRRHDYDRDVAARVETTMAMLDQWIAEADEEIVRLETLIEKRQATKASPLTAEEHRMVAHLAGAGYSIGEIARLIKRSEEVVARILEGERNRNQRAA
jgi:hypothetical protein